jgi:hypothetical protein
MYSRYSLTALFGILLALTVQAQDDLPFSVEPIIAFDEPWALTFLPDGRMLITEITSSRSRWSTGSVRTTKSGAWAIAIPWAWTSTPTGSYG